MFNLRVNFSLKGKAASTAKLRSPRPPRSSPVRAKRAAPRPSGDSDAENDKKQRPKRGKFVVRDTLDADSKPNLAAAHPFPAPHPSPAVTPS